MNFDNFVHYYVLLVNIVCTTMVLYGYINMYVDDEKSIARWWKFETKEPRCWKLDMYFRFFIIVLLRFRIRTIDFSLLYYRVLKVYRRSEQRQRCYFILVNVDPSRAIKPKQRNENCRLGSLFMKDNEKVHKLSRPLTPAWAVLKSRRLLTTLEWRRSGQKVFQTLF